MMSHPESLGECDNCLGTFVGVPTQFARRAAHDERPGTIQTMLRMGTILPGGVAAPWPVAIKLSA